jgi:copper homeostasis protein CutC
LIFKYCKVYFNFLKGDYDVKNINVLKDDITPADDVSNDALDLGSITTYKELNDDQMKKIVEFLISLDEKYDLFNLKYEKLHNEFFEEIINQKNEKLNKHLKQISQIVDHVNSLVKCYDDDDDEKSICLGVLFIKVYQ